MDHYSLPVVHLRQIFTPKKGYNGYLLAIDNQGLQVLVDIEKKKELELYIPRTYLVSIAFAKEKNPVFGQLRMMELQKYDKDKKALIGKLELPTKSSELDLMKKVVGYFKEFMTQ